MSTTDDLLAEIGEKLDKILGVLLVSNKDTDTQIRILRSLGHDWPFVGAATGLSPDAARMQGARKKSAKSRKRRK